MYVKNKVEFVAHLYSRTAGLLLIYSLLIKNGRRFISSTVLFSPVDRLFKMAINTVLRGGYMLAVRIKLNCGKTYNNRIPDDLIYILRTIMLTVCNLKI